MFFRDEDEKTREVNGVLGELHNGAETLIDLTIMSRRIRAGLPDNQARYRPMTWRITRVSKDQFDRSPEDKFVAILPIRPRKIRST